MVADGVEYWQIIAGRAFGSFDSDPWEKMGHLIRDGEFRWIDNDFNWEPRGQPPQENPPQENPPLHEPPTRTLHEMALSDASGVSFHWVWPERIAMHEKSGWIQTGRTRVMLSNVH
jgi:hypothetical protein